MVSNVPENIERSLGLETYGLIFAFCDQNARKFVQFIYFFYVRNKLCDFNGFKVVKKVPPYMLLFIIVFIFHLKIFRTQ